MVDQPERRKYPRISVDVPVELRKSDRSGSQAWTRAVVKDISYGGCFIETNEPFAVADRVQFNLLLPDGGEKIPVVAAVCWCKERDLKGIGVGVVQIAESDEERIDEFIEQALVERIDELLLADESDIE